MKMDTTFKITVEDLENDHAEMETEKKISLSYVEYRGAVKLLHALVDSLDEFNVEPEALQLTGFQLDINDDSQKEFAHLRDYDNVLRFETNKLNTEAKLDISNRAYNDMMSPVIDSASAMRELKFKNSNKNSRKSK